MLEDCEGPVADSQVGKQASMLFLKEQFSALLSLNADPEQKYWVFVPTNHHHHPALTGHVKVRGIAV